MRFWALSAFLELGANALGEQISAPMIASPTRAAGAMGSSGPC
jgi:hypothetical protein